MRSLVIAELRYQRNRVITLLAGAVGMAFFIRFVARLSGDGFGPESFDGLVLFPALLVIAGLFLHLMVTWDMTAESRLERQLLFPLSRRQIGVAQLVIPVTLQLAALLIGLSLWCGFGLAGMLDPIGMGTFTETSLSRAKDVAWFFLSVNGAGLVFLLGWLHLTQEIAWLKQHRPTLGISLAGAAVVIALAAGFWALSPWLAPILALSAERRPSHAVTALCFHSIALALAALDVWLFEQRPDVSLSVETPTKTIR